MTMNDQLKFFLQQGPTSVKELARLTGNSTSAIYKALKEEGVISTDSDKGKLFSMKPAAEAPTAAPVDGAEDTPPASVTETPREPVNYDPADAPDLARRGRKPTAAGKKLTANINSNERRANSHGYRSLQIILDNPGISTEDFLSKGGRLNDLRWDIARNRVRAEG